MSMDLNKIKENFKGRCWCVKRLLNGDMKIHLNTGENLTTDDLAMLITENPDYTHIVEFNNSVLTLTKKQLN